MKIAHVDKKSSISALWRRVSKLACWRIIATNLNYLDSFLSLLDNFCGSCYHQSSLADRDISRECLQFLCLETLFFMSEGGKQWAERCFTSPKLHGPLNNSKKAKLLHMINPRWEQPAQSVPPHTNLPLQSRANPHGKRDRDHLTSAGLSSLEAPLQPHRELQEALRSVKTCSVCPDPAPALSLGAVQWSNRTAQLHPSQIPLPRP